MTSFKECVSQQIIEDAMKLTGCSYCSWENEAK